VVKGPLLIDLEQPLPGQQRFVSTWLVPAADGTFLVDPGPPRSAPALLEALAAHGVRRLDLILLTHVHLDHAGATADVLARYPEARVAVHERGRPHLIAPERLWAGSRSVLGQVAEVYGEPRPVPPDALAGPDDLKHFGVRAVATPGHAAHHQSFVHDETLYLGEAAGTYLDLAAEGFAAAKPAAVLGAGSGKEPGAGYYLRPATPPRFIFEVALGSLDRLLGLRPEPRRLAFAHHGLHTGPAAALLARARDQLLVWVETAREEARDHLERLATAGTDATPALLDPTEFDELYERIDARLRATDPHYALVERLPEDIRQRERLFNAQSLRGILEYLVAEAVKS
jgi:glyoxylase-like metal-dependent hydrolase (beta-lactamase superfamily II)